MTCILFKFLIYPSYERALKNERVKSEIVRKLSLKIVVENARINFSISPYCTLFFSRKENVRFLKVDLPVVFWQWPRFLHYEYMRISALKYC